ncbi:MAG: hypothetical protein ACREN5_10030 [Gemmatimonadales bacterium]
MSGALTRGPLPSVIIRTALPAVAMMGCHFCFNLIDSIWVGRLIGPAVLAAVSTSTDPIVIQDGVLYLRVIALAQIGQTFEIILEGAMAGAGYTLVPMLVSSTLTTARVPLSAWWAGTMGVIGTWWALSLTAAARGVAMVVIWLRGAWRHRTV